MSRPAESSATIQSLFDAHFTALVRFAVVRVGDIHLAEDLAAECFVRALKHPDPAAITSGWLFQTARNLIGDTYRRKERDKKLLAALSISIRESDAHEDTVVLNALSRLSPADRELLLLLYMEKLPATDVAVMLKLSVTAVWKRSSRAKARLRTVLAHARSEPVRGSVITLVVD